MQFGVLYSEIRSACKRLYLATDGNRSSRDEVVGFRGYIGKLRITDRFIDHSELIREQWQGNVFEENFADIHQWKCLGKQHSLSLSYLQSIDISTSKIFLFTGFYIYYRY